MKQNQIEIGSTYMAKVSGLVVPVRIDRESPHGGWDATNMVTNKSVRIKSAQRLRGTPKPGKSSGNPGHLGEDGNAMAELDARDRAEDGAAKAAAPEAATSTSKTRRTPKADPEGQPRKMSGLDAAHAVLLEADEPLQAATMVERMIGQGLWSTTGKTPAATIYAAIIREIEAKGGDSRFKKTDRGLFTVAGV